MTKNKKDDNKFTRKEFLHFSAGMLGLGLIGLKAYAGMEYKIPKVVLGKTGIEVSPICYGASRSQESSLVRAVLDNGINFLDTGRSYARGQNEVMLGKTLKGIRKQVVIQSKLKVRINEDTEDLDSKDVANKINQQMQDSLDESLRDLQTDYIDIMLLHSASSEKILFHKEVLGFFEKTKKSGKIRAFGFSAHNNYPEVIEAAAKNPVYEIVMVPYNYKGSYVHSQSGQFNDWDQARLEKSLKVIHKNNIGVIAMKTCSAGPYSPTDSENGSFSNAIKWVLNQDYIDCAAVAMGNFGQIEENLAALK